MVKNLLSIKIQKVGFLIALISGTCIKFLNEFLSVLLALSPLLPLTTFLLLALNVFRADFLNNLVVFNKKVSNTAILLKY